jgi:predicted transcriptional regulator
MNDGQKDLRVSEVMKQMSVSQAAVLSWIKSGRLEAYNVAISETARPIYRVTQEALEAFKRSRGVVVKNDRRSRKKQVEIAGKITKFF